MTAQTWLALIIVGGIVLVLIVFRYRKQIALKFKWRGVSGSVEASNGSTTAVTAEKLKSRSGGVTVKDGTGRGANVRDVDARKDIDISSSMPDKGESPKA